MFDIVSMGEALFDMMPIGLSDEDKVTFHAVPGGATLNCMSQLSHLGFKTSYISAVGEDSFGKILKQAVAKEKIDTSCFQSTKEANTTLAFVHHDDEGDRSFSFYRNPGADMMITFGEDEKSLLRQSRAFHVGTISMTKGPAKQATIDALDYAQAHGLVISFDPNFRLNLWESEEDLLAATRQILPYCDYVKISSEELQLLTGLDSLEDGLRQLLETYSIRLIAVTDGNKKVLCSNGKAIVEVPAFTVKVVDTTGCGDSFTGTLLSRIFKSSKPVEEWTEQEIRDAVRFSNAAGAITATRLGAMPVLPSEQEVNDFLKANE